MLGVCARIQPLTMQVRPGGKTDGTPSVASCACHSESKYLAFFYTCSYQSSRIGGWQPMFSWHQMRDEFVWCCECVFHFVRSDAGAIYSGCQVMHACAQGISHGVE